MKFTFRYATGDTQCRHIFCHVTLICSIRTASAYVVIFLSENGRIVSNDNMIECQVLVSSGSLDMQHCILERCFI